MTTFCFDIDGTICTNTEGEYEKAELLPGVTSAINKLYDAGHTIYMHTARGSLTGINWTELTKQQLSTWGIKYHRLYMGKPPSDIYIDDKAINAKTWHEELEENTNVKLP